MGGAARAELAAGVGAAVGDGATAAVQAVPPSGDRSIPELRLRLPVGASPRRIAEATRAALAAALGDRG